MRQARRVRSWCRLFVRHVAESIILEYVSCDVRRAKIAWTSCTYMYLGLGMFRRTYVVNL